MALQGFMSKAPYPSEITRNSFVEYLKKIEEASHVGRRVVNEAREKLSHGGCDALAKVYETTYGVPKNKGDVDEGALELICQGYLIGYTEKSKP